jgi:hypothetical protein
MVWIADAMLPIFINLPPRLPLALPVYSPRGCALHLSRLFARVKASACLSCRLVGVRQVAISQTRLIRLVEAPAPTFEAFPRHGFHHHHQHHQKVRASCQIAFRVKKESPFSLFLEYTGIGLSVAPLLPLSPPPQGLDACASSHQKNQRKGACTPPTCQTHSLLLSSPTAQREGRAEGCWC